MTDEPVARFDDVEGHSFPIYKVNGDLQVGRCLNCERYPDEVAAGLGVFEPCKPPLGS
jgi:hypothetical protein